MRLRLTRLCLVVCLLVVCLKDGSDLFGQQLNREVVEFTPTIDGEISEDEESNQTVVEMSWPVSTGSLLLEGSGSGVENLSASWYLSWDDDNLNISAVVLDDTPAYRINAGTGNVAYNAQDVIQPVFNPGNVPDFQFVDGQPADGDPGLNVAAIYDMVVNTADDFGPDIYRHGPALSEEEHASITIAGTEFEGGYMLEASIPWATAMDDIDPDYEPSDGDMHGLGFILLSFNGEDGPTPDVATLYTDFGNGANTIAEPSTWNSITLVAVDNFAQCDFDQSGICDIADIEMLLDGLGGNESSLDMDGNGTVELADRDAWLIDAGTKEIGTAFVKGDADLDGDVESNDLNTVGINWQSQDATGWSQADFDGDGDVDSQDLNEVGISWQHGVAAPASTVPEPNGALLAIAGTLGLLSLRRRCSWSD